jgi:hypothetical protein
VAALADRTIRVRDGLIEADGDEHFHTPARAAVAYEEK